MTDEKHLRHLGIICDGNRRWAKDRGLPTLEGHLSGFERVKLLVDAFLPTEIEFISFFLFSTENWGRSETEVNYLMQLVRTKLPSLVKKLEKNNLRLAVMGRPEPVDPKLWANLMEAEQRTAQNSGKTVAVCFNYGGQWEIVDAANQAIARGEQLADSTDFAKYLYHPEIPACDVIVRTSGEQRISGFQLWRAAYAEFMFLDKFFPDLEASELDSILDEFHGRSRRFGK